MKTFSEIVNKVPTGMRRYSFRIVLDGETFHKSANCSYDDLMDVIHDYEHSDDIEFQRAKIARMPSTFSMVIYTKCVL